MTEASPPNISAMKTYWLVGTLTFLVCLLMTGGHLQSPDGELLYRTAESIALRGELHVNPIEYDEQTGQLLVPPQATFATVQGRGGHYFVQYLPLQAVLSTPFIWLGKATEPLFAEAFTTTLPHRGGHYTSPDTPGANWRRAVTVALFNPLITALTALVLLRLMLFVTGGNRWASVWTAVLFVAGTMALPHSRTYFTEPLAGLFALIAFDQLLRWYQTPLTSDTARRRLRQVAILGAAMAASIWTRMDSPVLAFGIGITLVAAGEWKRRRESAFGNSQGQLPLADYLVPGVLIVGSFALLVAFNAWRFAGNATLLGGGYSDQPEAVKFSTPFLVGLHGYLMSPGRGLFFFSPAILLAVWGWTRLPKSLRWVGWLTLGTFIPFALFQVKWQNWDGGWCWGPRHIFQLHAPLMIGAGVWMMHGATMLRRVVLKVFAAVGIAVNIFGSLQSPMDFYNEFFRSIDDGVYYTVPYREMEAMSVVSSFVLRHRDPHTGATGAPASPMEIPAAMVDSLYIPQHTQWNGYPAMLRLGMCDWWLLARVLPEPEQPEGLAR